jgi:hypothetical protein
MAADNEWEVRMDTLATSGVPDDDEQLQETIDMLFPSFQQAFERTSHARETI